MYIRIMSPEPLDDSDPRKGHRMLSDVSDYLIGRTPAGEVQLTYILDRGGEGSHDTRAYVVKVFGNVYIMDEEGIDIYAFQYGNHPLIGQDDVWGDEMPEGTDSLH